MIPNAIIPQKLGKASYKDNPIKMKGEMANIASIKPMIVLKNNFMSLNLMRQQLQFRKKRRELF